MNDIRESLPFLKMPGLFFAANRQIPDLPMDDLNEMFNDAMKKSDLNLANRIAEKISILYGINGLMLYFNASYLLAQENVKSHEIIDQDVIKILSLIFFVEKNLPADFDGKQIDELKEKFTSLCDQNSKDEIISEAHDVCEHYTDTVLKI